MMNNREYLRELVDVAIAMHKGRGMALYTVLGKILEANSNKINGGQTVYHEVQGQDKEEAQQKCVFPG
jgi:hypothetical protein